MTTRDLPASRTEPRRGDRGGRWVAAAAGVASGALTVAAADLVAGLVAPDATPVLAVGGAAVDLVPGSVKDFAVATFGAHDKQVLLGGTAVVLLVLSAVAGLLARRRPVAGLALVGVLGGLAAAAAVTRPGAGPAAAVPTLVGVVAGGAALLVLTALAHRAVRGRACADRATQASAGDRPATGGSETDPRPGRRPVLRGLAAVSGAAVLAGAGGRLLAARRAGRTRPADVVLPAPSDPAPALPSAVEVGVAGVTGFVTANRDFYRVDTALAVPRVDPDAWRLRVHGLVDREVTLSFDDVLRAPLVERTLTLTCVSNEVGGRLAGTATWLGLPLAGLLERAGVRPEADMVLSTSADGFTASTPVAALTDGRDALLAVGMNGEALPVEHGFPARLVVPGLFGYVSATKWVVDLELTRFDRATAYWTDRGWAPQAPVRTASRIDVPAPLARIAPGPTAVAGVAWAQRRGLRSVEVRVDGGDWRPARLAEVPNVDTWRQWVLEWDATPGTHTLQVRATDGEGRTQPSERRTPRPDGATGWHSVVVRVG